MLSTRRLVRAIASAAAVLAVFPASIGSAAPPPCPLLSDATVSSAVASPVYGGIMTDFISDTPLDTGPDKTVCMWDSDADTTIMVARHSNAFGPGGAPNIGAYVGTLMRIPAEAQLELDALRDAGVSDIKLPDFQLSNASGIGDAAMWVFQDDPALDVPSGGFVVQRGPDAYAITVIGLPEPEARTQAKALTTAVLSVVGSTSSGQ
jgi:hypothetical protein